jgi:hypothetical protein
LAPRNVPALAGAEAFTDIARFGEKKLDLLRRLRSYRDGTPAHDHLGDIFATLDAQAFQRGGWNTGTRREEPAMALKKDALDVLFGALRGSMPDQDQGSCRSGFAIAPGRRACA